MRKVLTAIRIQQNKEEASFEHMLYLIMFLIIVKKGSKGSMSRIKLTSTTRVYFTSMPSKERKMEKNVYVIFGINYRSCFSFIFTTDPGVF